MKRKTPVIEEVRPDTTSSLTQKARKEMEFKRRQNGSEQRMSNRIQTMCEKIRRKEAERAVKAAHERNTTTQEEDTNSKVEQTDNSNDQHKDYNNKLRQRMQQTLSKANEQGYLETILKHVAENKHQKQEPQVKANDKADVVRSRQEEHEENRTHPKIRKVDVAPTAVATGQRISTSNVAAEEPEVETDEDVLEDIYSQFKKDNEKSSSGSSKDAGTNDQRHMHSASSNPSSYAHQPCQPSWLKAVGSQACISNNRRSFQSSMAQLISIQGTNAKRRRTETQPEETSNSANASARKSKRERLHGQTNEVRKNHLSSKLSSNTNREEARAITALLNNGKRSPKMRSGPCDTHNV